MESSGHTVGCQQIIIQSHGFCIFFSIPKLLSNISSQSKLIISKLVPLPRFAVCLSRVIFQPEMGLTVLTLPSFLFVLSRQRPVSCYTPSWSFLLLVPCFEPFSPMRSHLSNPVLFLVPLQLILLTLISLVSSLFPQTTYLSMI